MSRFWPIVVPVLCVGAVGCIDEREAKGPVRGVWVTRWDYRTEKDVREVVRNCDSLGFNTILFQVRGNGTVFYPSRIEPWAEEFGFKDPGFDPLATAIDEAHRRGIALQAWVNVMPGWRGERPPASREQLYHTRPEWFLKDQLGRPQALTDHYVIVNPCLPEVRAYLTELFREICANYAIDGLHMDYIRFVTETSGSGIDYPYDERTLTLFKEATGKSPQDAPEAWKARRRDAVTRLVADIRAMMRKARPGAELTASVFGNRPMVRESLFQDGALWLEKGYVDAAYPMIYVDETEKFVEFAEDWRSHSSGKPIIPGIALYKHDTDATSIEQIERAWSWGDGFCLFAYGTLLPGEGDPGEKIDAAERQRRGSRQRERYRNLRPVLLSLAERQEVARR